MKPPYATFNISINHSPLPVLQMSVDSFILSLSLSLCYFQSIVLVPTIMEPGPHLPLHEVPVCPLSPSLTLNLLPLATILEMSQLTLSYYCTTSRSCCWCHEHALHYFLFTCAVPLTISLKAPQFQRNPLTPEVGGHSKYDFGMSEWWSPYGQTVTVIYLKLW